VEPWIFDPYDDKLKPNPQDFRLWAIKVAVLRSYYEHQRIPQPEDIRAVYDREDIPQWHIFVGHMGLPHHSHTFVGVGPVAPTGGRIAGVTQVSWSLGRVMIIAIRVIGDDKPATDLLNMFRQSNFSEGMVVSEVLPDAARLPSVALLPKLNDRGYTSMAWYFSTHPLSPIAHVIRGLDDEVQQAARQLGVPIIQL
jgi:hypothetical protein